MGVQHFFGCGVVKCGLAIELVLRVQPVALLVFFMNKEMVFRTRQGPGKAFHSQE